MVHETEPGSTSQEASSSIGKYTEAAFKPSFAWKCDHTLTLHGDVDIPEGLRLSFVTKITPRKDNQVAINNNQWVLLSVLDSFSVLLAMNLSLNQAFHVFCLYATRTWENRLTLALSQWRAISLQFEIILFPIYLVW